MLKKSSSKICLMGFMASGKSFLGRSLANELQRPFLDLDSYIEEQEKQKIHDIFKERGEKAFRILEEIYLKNLLESQSTAVIALGGGTAFNPSNLNLIQSHSLSLYLEVPIGVLISRLSQHPDNRPMLKGITEEELPNMLTELFLLREESYSQADVKVNATELSEELWKPLLPEIKSYLK